MMMNCRIMTVNVSFLTICRIGQSSLLTLKYNEVMHIRIKKLESHILHILGKLTLTAITLQFIIIKNIPKSFNSIAKL